MKKGFFSVLLLVTMSLNLAWGTVEVPVKVQETFKTMYPKANFAEWRMDDDVFVVSYKIGEVECESAFGKNGKWTETRSTQTAEILSQSVKEAIIKKYPECELEEVIVVEKPGSKRLEVWVQTKSDELVTVVINEKNKIVDTY